MMDEKNIWPGWETVRLIGRGSFGTVYEIQRDVLGEIEKAALKVISLPQNDSDIEELYSEGYNEASVTAAFQSHLKSIIGEYSLMRKMNGSTNIVNCDDVRYIQQDNGIGWNIYIKMELLTPMTKALPAVVPEETVVAIAKDLCAALELCKKHGIIHRDIKPQNIFLSPNGDYKLGDFGIAKTVEKTSGGTKIGTYKYMAPEVYHNQPYGVGADIYSLGLVLYWLLNSRRLPFLPQPNKPLVAGMEERARQRRFAGEPLPPPTNGSRELKAIVLKACAYDPRDRYQSAAEMLADLNRLGSAAAFVPPIFVPTAAAPAAEFADEQTIGTGLHAKPAITPAVPAAVPAPKQAAPVPGWTSAPVQAVPQQNQIPTNAKASPKKEEKKKKILLPILLGIGVLILILILLLRGCGSEQEPAAQQPGSDPAVTETTKAPTELPTWSDWVETLPADVTAEDYEIEEQVLYRYQTLETTSSTASDRMEGWELYDTVSAGSGYGQWSDWSANAVSATNTRQVETQTRYRYRDKETTTGSASTMNGWELYDTTYAWGSYGNWSDWSTSAVSASDSREVESKTQYRYRDITYTQEYSAWSAWSNWQNTAVTATDLRKVETRQAYRYYCFYCKNCGAAMPYQGHLSYSQCYTELGGCGRSGSNYYISGSAELYLTNTPKSGKYWNYDKYYVTVNGQKWYISQSTSATTQYRYATRTTQQVANYGSWSSWGDTAYSASSSREVETRTVYRYRDRSQVPTYHFYRWGSWSAWSANQVSAGQNRQVESQPFYRYRDQVLTTTYYFRRWSDWTEYSATEAIASDTVNVETKTLYRYKKKV